MDCVSVLATKIASKIGEMLMGMLVGPIGAQLGYLIHYDNNINNMHDALKALQDKKQEVQGRVNVDKRNGREIFPHVEDWLQKVADIEVTLQRFCANEEANRNKECLGGWCPNLNTRYSFSKEAKETMAKLVLLNEKKFETISNPAPLPKLSSAFAKGIKSFESRKSIVEEVIEKLNDDRFNRLSICGMGGVGKTTLVKEVIKIIEAKKLFDKVVMTAVSQTPDLKKIQGEIADRLDLKFDKETLQGRAYQLLDRINKTTRLLIVLDDIWTELDFESIGLPSNDDCKTCKVIFTSRNEGTCHRMGSQKTFTVDTLSQEESWDLFREITSDDVVGNPDIRPIAEKIVIECGGLPIAIVIVGKTVLGKKERYAWKDALNRLTKSPASFSEVEKCIELSYNLLDEKAKYFLFLCCLFPEDADIPIEDLMREGWGLGLFTDQDVLCEVRNEVHTLMNDLKTCYLLLDSDKEECVKMHDVVRDVVISIASKKEHDFRIHCDAERKWQEKSPWNCNSAVSIMIDGIKERPNVMEYSKLELLKMASKEGQEVPVNFFQGMSMLKVLCLETLCIPNLFSQFQALNNLRTLRLEDCEVGDISIIGKELLTLEILSFARSNIKELPIEIGQLRFLRLLDLTECNDLDKFSSNILTSLSRLEELYFRVENFPWMLNNDILMELKKISRQLKVVEIRVRKVELLPKDLIFENMERFWVYLVPYFNFHHSGYLGSSILQLTVVDYNSIKCSMMINDLVKKCEILIIEKVKNLENFVFELEKGARLPLLKDLKISECSNLMYLFEEGAALPHLKDLKITKCSNLKYLLEEGATLPHLNDLKIEDCSNLVYLVNGGEGQKSMIDFSNLVNLELIALPSLVGFSKVIDLNKSYQSMPHELSFTTESGESTEVEDGEIVSGSHSKPSGYKSLPISGKLFSSIWMKQFPKLERILLQGCSSLEMVFDLQGYSLSNCQPLAVSFPQLKEVKIDGANNLTSVWGNVSQFVQGFQNLRSLKISNCNSLSHVFTPAIVKEITKLENLKISTCRLMSNLVARNRDDEEDDNKAKDSFKLEWPSLRKLEIKDCPLLEISLMPTQVHAKQDSLGVKSYPNIQDTSFSNFKENNSRINWPLGCTSLLSKFIPQGGKNKRSSKAVLLAQDHVPSIFEMKSKIEIGHMPILEDLYVRKCDLLDVLFLLEEGHNSTIPSCLKTIKIEDCDKLETIVAKRDERQDMLNSFAQLESLNLQELPNLRRFCIFGTGKSLNKQEEMGTCEGDQRRIGHDPLIDGFLFPNLTSLFIQDCNNIGILFSHSSLRSLERLVKLEIRDCKNIEEIVSQEEIEANVNKIIFCGLQHLLLIRLPNLKAFCQGSYDFEFPSLREVRIEGCPNIEVFSQRSSYTPKLEDVIMKIEPHSSNYIRQGDLNATIQGFKAFVELQNSKMLSWSKLKEGDVFGYFLKKSEMNVSEFHNLLSLVPFNETQKLRDLKQFTIEDCDSLLEVFQLEGGVDAKKGDTTMHIIHYELQKMHLVNLPQLKHIWKHNITQFVSFSKLTKIKIIICHSLKSLLSHSLARSLEQLERLVVRRCEMMEEIVTKEDENNTEGGSKVKTLFPKLKSLKLEYLPKLERVCSGEYDYDLPFCDVGEDKEMNNKVEISFPELERLFLIEVPSLKCFCSGAYDYDLMLSSSSNAEITEECPQITTFPNETVTVSTPNLHYVMGAHMRTLGDLNLTIHYMQNREKYMVELQKLDTFRCINQHLLGYITRETWLVLKSCDKLLNGIPSNMMHLFQHLRGLNVRQCGSLEEIFESDDYEGDSTVQHELYKIELDSLPKLRHIWKNHGPVLGFQNLEYLQISRCHDLKYVFHDVSIARSLPRLFGFEVRECNKMEEIIQNNNRSVQEQQPKQAKIIFPSMHWLRLKKLPSLNCFCPSSCYFELPQCKYITIEECPQMETFCYETLYTPGLFSLYVEGTEVDKDEEVNEVVQEIRQRKLESGG